MLVKLLGCLLILISTSGFGYFKGLEYRKHIDEIQRLKHVIWQLRGEMKYTRLPLDAICRKLQTQTEEPYASWLRNISKRILEKGAMNLGVLWEEVTKKDLKELFLTTSEMAELSQLGYQLGHMDIGMQEQILCWYEEQLEEKRKKLSEKLDEKRRLCNCLGVMGGIFLIIVLL